MKMRWILFLLFSIATQLFSSESALGIEGKTLLVPNIDPRDELERVLVQQRKSGVWSEDYPKTLKLAQTNQKPILLAFVGIGWCPWSERLAKEILNEPDFLNPLKDQVNFVWFSCPQESSKGNKEFQRLKEKYAVQVYPTLVLISPSQEEMFSVGYLPYTPEEFAEKFQEMIRDYNEISSKIDTGDLKLINSDELERLFTKARDLKCVQHTEKLMQVGLECDKGTFFLLEKYAELLEKGSKKEAAPIREKIIGRDPKNLKGSQLRLAILDFEMRAQKLKRKESPLSAVKPLLEYIYKFGERDKENLWKIQMMMAQFLFTKNEVKEALGLANASYQSAPEEFKSEVAHTIDYLKSYVR